MIDREWHQKQLDKWKRIETSYRELAQQYPKNADFFTKKADRAAAYVSDYESDLAK
jgi:hypothetical protein